MKTKPIPASATLPQLNRNPVPRIRAALAVLVACSFTTFLGAEVPTLREGDPVLEAELLDEEGTPVDLSVRDRPTLVTFIFTRCAAMEFCPRMNQRFEDLQKAATDGEAPPFRLLSITLDPEHDRPDRLKEFGKVIGAEPDIWNFATGSTEEIDRLTEAFRVFRKEEQGTLNHTLCTALVLPDGTIQKIWRGNFWKAEDALAELRKI